jgi:hypothetical protein
LEYADVKLSFAFVVFLFRKRHGPTLYESTPFGSAAWADNQNQSPKKYYMDRLKCVLEGPFSLEKLLQLYPTWIKEFNGGDPWQAIRVLRRKKEPAFTGSS